MGGIGFFLFGRLVAYYGLMILLGIFASIPLAYFQVRRFRLKADDLVVICGIGIFFGIIGAKALYLFVSREFIDVSMLADLSYTASLLNGGFVFLGGVAAGFPAAIFCSRKLKISVQPYIQACMGCIPIVHGFGRIGCFLTGCCYGIPYSGFFSVVYTQSQFAPNGTGLFPVQLLEASAEFILGGCLLAFSRKLRGVSSLFCYLLFYSVLRFFLEFLRYDEIRGGVGFVSTSQILSIAMFVFSLLYFIKSSGKGRSAE